MTTFSAIYENGMLRPSRRLPFEEGEAVEVTIIPAPIPLRQPTPEEWTRKVQAAKSIEEWMALANSCPVPDDGYDVIQAMNETRRANGEQLLTREN